MKSELAEQIRGDFEEAFQGPQAKVMNIHQTIYSFCGSKYRGGGGRKIEY